METLCKVHMILPILHLMNSHLKLPGITGGFGGDRRVEYIIPQEAREQGVYEFVIESSCNGMFGIPFSGDIIDPPDMNRYFSLASADLVVPNVEAWGLLWDFQTLREIVDTLPGNTPCVYFSY
jgi:alpha-mannosidase